MIFEEIYELYWQKIFRLCMGYVNDSELARDLAQETFIIVWQQLPKFRNESSVGTWIFRIASNNCLRQIEKEKKFAKTDLPINLEEKKQESMEPQIQMLYQFISELAETDRIIISLELEEIKQAEIAHIVGLSESNIRVKIHRIKEKLTQKFKENGY
ncbi:RNA polymerase sigma-70 factor (ECF subfamily) [Chryseobacterium bernardetii]|jgi:RNA polymerase sigma-70 factor (ECF subfamily)|uniref:RNA polymerase sigma-70 factor (ECF subfamily) n=3 Tax=Chryseobacterium TaxID=59732 RepID=A0A543ENT3_9FLAO|nr:MULTISPECIES: sigma-70 family RNA polymerase sigma factor [Chryseobacterium]MDR6369628.1 RNA polymerase sigma-70 factor (ECF subfamily) [Chryseobacterium vietnamense]MDR6439450.1 RNA polymerase sigma-70 factor (ECF subfamily) [Chryseobacterium bernardetii]MDR6459030.1 RNA polymerase sigma-70 factor (ECF subfamily) [Chryseobacterium vietnamense]TQM23234.1 RNA polymerase sigma-70 factor (ECF subfamily) [Chryseobacterium aquifrigidense]